MAPLETMAKTMMAIRSEEKTKAILERLLGIDEPYGALMMTSRMNRMLRANFDFYVAAAYAMHMPWVALVNRIGTWKDGLTYTTSFKTIAFHSYDEARDYLKAMGMRPYGTDCASLHTNWRAGTSSARLVALPHTPKNDREFGRYLYGRGA